MNRIHLAEGLDLNAEDLLESAVGIIAKRGRGKSGAVKVLMEELTSVGLPFVALDPVGILWGIRSSFDGTGPGLPVLVIGGEHGDVPLERKAGAAVADRVIKENISCVIDFSEEPKAAYREFVRDFAHELFRKNDTPRMVILEEAPELVPQKVQGDRAETFEAVERLVSRGRNKGLGVVLVSQRAATINKDVLTQIDVLVVLGLAAPQDRKALGDWIRAWDQEGQADVFDKGLAGLHRQEAWVWSPEAFGGLFQRVKFRDFTTFHPDKTHLRRMGWLKVRPVTADVAGAVARFKGGKKPEEEPKVDATKEKEYEDRIKRVEAQLLRTQQDLAETRMERATLRQELKAEHDRAEANARAAETHGRQVGAHRVAAAARAIAEGEHVESSESPSDLPEGQCNDVSVPITHGADRDRIDLHVQRETPDLTVHVVERRVDETAETPRGKVAALIAEGFFDAPRKQADAAAEMLQRGWGNYKGGNSRIVLYRNLQELTTWGFLRYDGSAYTVVQAARARIRVRKEAA